MLTDAQRRHSNLGIRKVDTIEFPEKDEHTYFLVDSVALELVAKVRKLNGRAKKLGLDEMEIEFVEPIYLETHHNVWRDVNLNTWYEPVGLTKFNVIHLMGSPPQVNGWKFVGALDHTYGEGVIVRALQFEGAPDLSKYFTSPSDICEHCHTIRRRNNTYLLQHEQSKEIIQVGSSCLKDFTGHASPETYAKWLDAQCAQVSEAEGKDYYVENSPRPMHGLSQRVYLAYVAKMVTEYGWLSKSAAREATGDTTSSTASLALEGMFPAQSLQEDIDKWLAAGDDYKTWPESLRMYAPPVAKYWEIADKAITWAKTLPEDSTNSYENNCRVVGSSDYILYKDCGISASMVNAVHKLHRNTNSAEIDNSHWGEVGSREDITLVFEGATPIEGKFGISTLHQFRDTGGRKFTWFASNGIGNGHVDLEQGHAYKLRGTIKCHREFRGQKQTQLTRVVPVEAALTT